MRRKKRKTPRICDVLNSSSLSVSDDDAEGVGLRPQQRKESSPHLPRQNQPLCCIRKHDCGLCSVCWLTFGEIKSGYDDMRIAVAKKLTTRPDRPNNSSCLCGMDCKKFFCPARGRAGAGKARLVKRAAIDRKRERAQP
jgi:hypothetical protein